MLNLIDNFLNKITMYRLVLYALIAYITTAVILSFFGILSYHPLDIIVSTVVLTVVCLLANKLFAMTFKVPANSESDYITALILVLIITPTSRMADMPFLIWAGVLSQACKYILAYKGKHLFNPAAFAVVITSFLLGQAASWWVGTAVMLPVVIIGGLLILRKIQRFDLFFSFLVATLVTIVIATYARTAPLIIIKKALIDTPMIFFSTIMLTEPMTTPPTRRLRVIYGGLVGILHAPMIHFGSIYSTPELALLVGNIFSYAVSPKGKFLLTLKSKKMIGANIYDFVFSSNRKLNFNAGQYLEWTLGHKNPDTRGNRRYFTIASSPTENEVHLGLKFYEPPSSYKKSLLALKEGQQIQAGSLSGDFTLPKDANKKLVFIAGGIGITPFRSMIKYLIDKGEKRDAILLYAANSEDEFAYKDIFQNAQQLGIKVLFETQKLTAEIIANEVPDFSQRTFYISGPHGMVVVFEKTLHQMGVPRTQIVIDFFPGYA